MAVNKLLTSLSLVIGDTISAGVELQATGGTAAGLKLELVFLDVSDVVLISNGVHVGNTVPVGDSVDATGPWYRSYINNLTIPAGAIKLNVGFSYDSLSISTASVSSRRPVLNKSKKVAPFMRPSNDGTAGGGGISTVSAGLGISTAVISLSETEVSMTNPTFISATAPASPQDGWIWFDTGTNPTVAWADITGTPTTLAGYAITDAEAALGNPLTDGFVLSSTIAGVRSWVTGSGGLSASANETITGAWLFTPGITASGGVNFLNSERLSSVSSVMTLRSGGAISSQLKLATSDSVVRGGIAANNTGNVLLTDAAGLTLLNANSTGLQVTGTITSDGDLVLDVGNFVPAINYELPIGNPLTDGFILSSTIAGVRSWIAAGGSEVNDLTAAVTWANIPIANVPTGTTGSTVSLGNHTHTFASLTSKPTTISGYGITDSMLITTTSFIGDMNTIKTPIAQRIDSTSTNQPTAAFYSMMAYGNSGNVTGQLATHYITGETYTRAFNNVWSAWRKQLDDVNFVAGTDYLAAGVNVTVGAGTDISPTAGGAGQLKIAGLGYAGFIALDAGAMHIGHNSAARDLVFQTDETDRLTLAAATGAATFVNTISVPALTKIFLDGNGDTYLIESAANVMSFFAGNVEKLTIDSTGVHGTGIVSATTTLDAQIAGGGEKRGKKTYTTVTGAPTGGGDGDIVYVV